MREALILMLEFSNEKSQTKSLPGGAFLLVGKAQIPYHY